MKIGKIKFSICTFQFAISNIITHHGGTGAPRQWTPRSTQFPAVIASTEGAKQSLE